jgi:chemotaxis protein methyltransferase CheR
VNLQQLNQRQFDRFRDYIYQKSGIRIDERKVSLLSNRIRRRLRTGHFEDFDAYYRHLTSRKGVDELEYFLDAITTNETSFFRSENHFTWFKSKFLPEVVAAGRQGKRQRSLRIWSAACASGAEAYTLAICIAENRFLLRDWTITILGTDISEQTLGKAREGTFHGRAMEGVSEQQRRRYFQSSGDTQTWKVRTQLKHLVQFENHNLMEPSRQPPFDCIFIRNVLIYFDRDSKQTVVTNLMAALAAGGYLVVGPSEGIYDMLQPLKKHSAFLYQKI